MTGVLVDAIARRIAQQLERAPTTSLLGPLRRWLHLSPRRWLSLALCGDRHRRPGGDDSALPDAMQQDDADDDDKNNNRDDSNHHQNIVYIYIYVLFLFNNKTCFFVRVKGVKELDVEAR